MLGVDVVVPDIVKAALFRIDGPVPGVAADVIGLLTPAHRVFDEVGFTLLLTCVGFAALFFLAGFIAGRFERLDVVRFAVLQLPLIIPIVQVAILRNHTIIHAGIGSRTFVLFGVLPLLTALAVYRSPTASLKDRTRGGTLTPINNSRRFDS